MIAKLLETRGRFYAGTYQYNKALEDYFLAHELYLKEGLYERVLSLYTTIGSSHYYLSLYEQALLYYIQAENIIQNHFHDFTELETKKGLVSYNKMLCYRKLNDFKSVLNELNKFRELNIKDEHLKMQVLIVEGNTYRDLSSYDKAEKIYNRVLKKSDATPDTMLLVYENYAELYYIKKEYEKSLEYIQKAFSYTFTSPPNYSIRLAFHMAKTHFALENIEDSIKQINQALILSSKISDSSSNIELSIFLAKIYFSTKQYDLAEKILIEKEMMLKKELKKESLANLYVNLLLIYTETNDIIKCREVTSKLSMIYNNS